MNLRALPKLELHHHLDGALRVRTILEEGRRMRLALPADTEAKLRPHVTIPRRCRSLAHFLRTFDVFVPVLRSARSMERAAYEACEDQAADGVIYFETRFAPSLMTAPGFGMEAAVRAALRGLRRGRRDFGVEARLILCLYRGDPAVVSLEVVRLAHRLGCAGIDLAGDERRHPAAAHARAFARARALGVPITIHAGEAGPERNIGEAMSLGARRIGHGIALRRLVDEVRRRDVTVEMCLTSNLHTGEVPSLRRHPFGRLHKSGVPLTLSTDDPGVSAIRLSGELELARETFGLGRAELMRLQCQAARAAFAPEPVRRRLEARVLRGWR